LVKLAGEDHALLGMGRLLIGQSVRILVDVAAIGGQRALMTSLGGHPATHVLSEEFFTQVPIDQLRWGCRRANRLASICHLMGAFC
jgi:hypothetical protein